MAKSRFKTNVLHHTVPFLTISTITSFSLIILFTVGRTAGRASSMCQHCSNYLQRVSFGGPTNLEKLWKRRPDKQQEGQHPLTGQHAANFRLLANQ